MRVPTSEAQAQIEIKRSKFISYAQQVTSALEVKHAIEQMWRTHPQASHVVHAFMLGDHGDQFGMSDDHEPKNTAGRPVLEVLKGSGLTNILVMVVRYFGGTKLGTGGLVKAYTQAAQEVLAGLASEELIDRYGFKLKVPYEIFQPVHTLLTDHQADMLNEQFGTEVVIEGRIPVDQFESAASQIQNISAGACSLNQVTSSQDE
jgi:uncharacterized YigZ family protein